MQPAIRELAAGHDETRRESALVKFYYADGDWCYRAMQTVHAIFHKDGKLIARAERGDRNGYYEFEIVKFEVIGPGYAYEGSPT